MGNRPMSERDIIKHRTRNARHFDGYRLTNCEDRRCSALVPLVSPAFWADTTGRKSLLLERSERRVLLLRIDHDIHHSSQ